MIIVTTDVDRLTNQVVIEIDLEDQGRCWDDYIDYLKFAAMSQKDIIEYCRQYKKIDDRLAIEVWKELTDLWQDLFLDARKVSNMNTQNFKMKNTNPNQKSHLLTQKEYMQSSKFEYLKSRTQAYQDKIAKLEKAHAFWNTTGLILLCSLVLCFFVAWIFIVPIVLGLMYVAHNRKRLAKQIAQNEGYLSMIENQVMDLKDGE